MISFCIENERQLINYINDKLPKVFRLRLSILTNNYSKTYLIGGIGMCYLDQRPLLFPAA